jgi:putative lipoic acid-binding regulatory protein
MADVKVITGTNLEDMEFPTEIIFKAILRSGVSHSLESIKSILAEREISATVKMKESRNGSFISYTVSGIFPSHECLRSVCGSIASLEGYMTLF